MDFASDFPVSINPRNSRGPRIDYCGPNYTAFDIETTGFSSFTSEIIEIAAVRVRNYKPVADFSTLIHPIEPIPKKITKLTGISDDMVSDAPPAASALTSFLDFIGDDILLGHNAYAFDAIFLCDVIYDQLHKQFLNPIFDTLYFSRDLISNVVSYKLEDLADVYYIEKPNGSHRALADCYTNIAVYDKLRMNEQPVIDIPSDNLSLLKYLGLIPKKAKSIPQLYYSGVRCKTLTPCEFIELVSEQPMIACISVNGEMFDIAVDYLKDMQPTKKEREAIEK